MRPRFSHTATAAQSMSALADQFGSTAIALKKYIANCSDTFKNEKKKPGDEKKATAPKDFSTFLIRSV